MIKPRCPDPERLALLIENRIGRMARARILRHAADCVGCRRHLAVASLDPIGPLRAALERSLESGRLTVCAGLLLGALTIGFLHSGRSAEPAPRPVTRTPAPKPEPPRARVSEAPAGWTAPERLPVPVPATVVVAPPVLDKVNGSLYPREEPDAAAPVSDIVAPAMPPRRLESVAEGPRPPPPEPPKALESESLGRLAILDPFGGLALEGAGGRQPVQGSRVVPVEARLVAVGRTSGFRLGDDLRIQLAPGSSIAVFQNLGHRCAGLSIFQGALLVQSTQPQSIFLRREGVSGVLEGMIGPVSVSAGTKAGCLTVVPLGTAAVWRRTGGAAVDIAAGETLGVDAAAQDVSAKKPRPSMARFVGWPEPSSLFYSSFEDGVEGMERPTVVQGVSREGHIAAAVAGGKGRKTIELTLPAALQTLPTDATLRLRVRTTAVRIQCGVGGNSSRSVPVSVAQRSRSDTVWTTVSVALSALDQDGGRHGRGGGGPKGLRGNLTLVAEAPSRVTAEDLVFDVDEIEITRS